MSSISVVSHILRRAGLLEWADQLRMYGQKWKYFRSNQAFKRDNPQVILPSDAIMYETFNLNYRQYYYDGLEVAKWILSVATRYHPPSKLRLLDWGCGPARVVRHLPLLAGKEAGIFGSDFNHATISWCREYIPSVTFLENELDPPIGYPEGYFNFIYGISILTHLSEQRHQSWIRELNRLLAPDGILLLTTQGKGFTHKLTSEEQADFIAGKLVIRGNSREGRRVYSAFHPTSYLESLFSSFLVLEHIEHPKSNGNPEQDIWILKKTSEPT